MNWWIDFGIGVALLAIIPFALAAYGGHVAADSITDARKRRITKAWFWGLGFVGLLVAVVSQYRTMKSDDARRSQTEQFQTSVNQRLDKIIQQPPSEDRKKEAVKLQHLVKKANPASPRLGTGPEAYKDIEDAQIVSWALQEADKSDHLANSAMHNSDLVGGTLALHEFTDDFKDCCADDLRDLRTEILRRLGPSGKDIDEIQAWTGLFPETKYPGVGTLHRVLPMSVVNYAPYFRRLAYRLRRRSTPRAAPTALKFSISQMPPEKLGYSHIIVTIETGKELFSGYIAVQFLGSLYSAGCDFKDSKSTLTSETDIDNPRVLELLGDSTGKVYMLTIGKTPFLPNNPIHVEARASSALQVSAVTYFEE